MKRLSVLLVLAVLVLTGVFSAKKVRASGYGQSSKPFEFNIEDGSVRVNISEGEAMHFGFAKEQKSGAKANPKKSYYEIEGKVYKVSNITSIPGYDNLGWYDFSYLKGKDVTFAYGVTSSINEINFTGIVHIAPGDKRFKVFYRGVKYKDNDEVKISRAVFTGAQVNEKMVGSADTGYFYFVGEVSGADKDEADVKLIDVSKVFYRRDGAMTGGGPADLLSSDLKHMMLNGSTLIFQKDREEYTWFSKEVKIKYPRQLSAPTIKVNEKKEFVTLTNKLEYKIYINGREESGWINVKDNHPDIKGQQLSYYDLIVKKSDDGKTTLLTKENIQNSTVTIEARIVAKAKNQPSRSKTLEITLPSEEPENND
ncbi:MAG: hypothetical protein K5858_04200 [Lachnospiraceae bacterium]|nr:hypothetical protein [Lachnospiraceae bacterium]